MLRKLFECLAALVLVTYGFVALLGWADAAIGATAADEPSPYVLDANTIAYVSCGDYMGTAVYLGAGEYLTAAHVIGHGGGCSVLGKPIRILHIDLPGDWALFHADIHPAFHAVLSCSRLVEGQVYFSSGFAEGMPWPVTTRLIGESFREDGESYLRGNIVNGMSGGPISDMDGVVHAINDTRSGDGIPHSGVVEIADTTLCHKGTS